MAEDIKIQIDVEDSTAMAKLAALQAQLDKLGGPEPGSAGSMKAGIKVGQWFPEQLEQMAAAGGRYKQVMDEVSQSTQGVTGATNELSEETQRAGINIESMLTRMAVRMVIFEAARLAIGYLVNEFKQMAELETARVQFENLTTAMEHTVEIEEKLKTTAFETNIAEKDLSSALISLYEAGEAPLEASKNVDTLGKISAATGIPVKELGKGLLDLQMDKTTVPEMFRLAEATGEAKAQMIAAVQQYAELERSIKLAQHVRAEELATMREEVTAQDRLIDAEVRAADVASKAAEKQIADWERVSGVRENFLEKMLGAEGKPPGQADPLLARAMQPGGLPQTAGGKQMTADIAAGFQRIYDEENLTTQGMQHFVDTGQIGLREILAAAKRLHEAEKEARDKALADAKEKAESEKRANQDRLSALAKEDAVAKKQETVELDTTRLSLEKQITDEVLKQQNHAKGFAEAMGTAAEIWKTIAHVFTTPTSEMPLYSGQYVTPGEKGALQSLGIIKESNSDKIAGHLERIEGALTGHGTP
jgi:hypothetical protein